MSFLIAARGNDALTVNPTDADKSLTVNGSNWLWAVTAVFAISLLSWLVWSTLLRAGSGKSGSHTATHRSPERVFHYLLTIAAFAGLIAYFSMASDLGNAPVRQYSHLITNNYSETRQVFYARYIYWFVAWPTLIVATLLLSGVSWATILFAVFIQEIWVVSWLSGAFITTSYRWGYFTFGVFAYLVLAFILLSWGRSHLHVGSRHYTPLAAFLILVWALYPIAWGLSEGSNYLSVTGEMVFYGILDLLTVPVYGFLLLTLSRGWDYGSLDLNYTQNGRIGGGGGRHLGNGNTATV